MLTAFYAGIFGLVHVILTLLVVRQRFKHLSLFGTVNHEGEEVRELTRTVRAHGNFVETVPIALIIMLSAELSEVSFLYLHIGGVLLILGRLAHGFALLKNKRMPYRPAGMILTLLSILWLSAHALFAVDCQAVFACLGF
tara:strand:+ start:1044 stop:1463 length:420 start_codon:yes stop_codon:yes gene_type:complete